MVRLIILMSFLLLTGCLKFKSEIKYTGGLENDLFEPDVLQVTGGSTHACAIIQGGKVRCWGSNLYTMLGKPHDEVLLSGTPIEISGLEKVQKIVSKELINCVLLQDKTVRCWGYNGNGQMGDGTFGNYHETVATPSGLSGVEDIIMGYRHVCALKEDESVMCWGYNNQGQLGDNTIVTKRTPVAVNTLGTGSTVSFVTAGYYHTCVLLGDATVKCWGKNDEGQLGDSSNTDRHEPTAVSALTNVISLATGSAHTCALIEDETVKCWGLNAKGQLGDGSTIDRNIPVFVAGLTTAIEIRANGGDGL